jgi:hypothetical protein
MMKYLIQTCGSLTLCPLQYFQMNFAETFRVNVGSSAKAKVNRSSTADIQSPLSASSLLIFSYRLWCQPITLLRPRGRPGCNLAMR